MSFTIHVPLGRENRVVGTHHLSQGLDSLDIDIAKGRSITRMLYYTTWFYSRGLADNNPCPRSQILPASKSWNSMSVRNLATLTIKASLVGGFIPIENISQLGWLFPIHGKISHVPVTTNQWTIKASFFAPSASGSWHLGGLVAITQHIQEIVGGHEVETWEGTFLAVLGSSPKETRYIK